MEILSPILSSVAAGFLLLSLSCVFWRYFWFFRNPPRKIPACEGIISPADGTIVYVKRLEAKDPVISIKKNRKISISDIVNEDLAHTRILIGVFMSPFDVHYNRAPISGVVVSGDYTRALGSPVERGQILYKVSPLDQYRVLLDVDESDIAELTVGMTGELTLSAAAEETFEIVVDKITPVSVPGEGANYFQVEASLVDTPEFLRPGMQGVSKIAIGERQLLWIWTHKLVDWLRLQLWSWF